MDKKDFRLYRLSGYEYNKQLYFAAIWVKDQNPRRWAVKRDLSDQGFRNAFNEYLDAGFRLENIAVYQQQKQTRYSGVWLENDKKITRWPHRQAVDALIKDSHSGKTARCCLARVMAMPTAVQTKPLTPIVFIATPLPPKR
jgi:hypothetical protein